MKMTVESEDKLNQAKLVIIVNDVLHKTRMFVVP